MAQRNDNERIAVERKQTGGSAWIWILGAIALAAIALFVLIPLFNNDDSAGLEQGATISEIVQAPNTYAGKTVTVSGAVNDVIGPRAFTIGGDELYGDAQLLIVSASALPTTQGRTAEEALLARDVVQVTGPVRLFNLAEFEKAVGVDLDDASFEPYAGKPAVIARAVDLTPYLGAADGAPDAAIDANVTLNDITANLAAYTGKSVLVNGGINVVKGEHAFTVADSTLTDANEVLVVSANEQALDKALVAEAPVAVQGSVRAFNLAEVEQALGYDLDDNLFADFAGKPVIIASAVRLITPAGEPADAAGIANVTLDEITENPAAFAGHMVVVDGGVNVVLNENAFTIADNTLLDTNEVLVLNATGRAPARALQADEPVIVAGTARTFNLAEVEQELGYDLDDALFTNYEGKPVILAQGVRVAAPREGGIGEPMAPAAGAFSPITGEEALNAGMVPGMRNLTVAEIASGLPELAGQQVAVRAEVEEVISPYAFSLDEDATLAGGVDNDLLVLSANQNNALINQDLDDQTVLVQGTVRPFDMAAYEQELGYDLDDALFTSWAGRPAIIAKDVRALNTDANTLVPEAGMTGRLMNATVAEIASDTAAYIGKPVAVTGEVEEVISPTAFSIDEDATFAGGIDSDLLVVAAGQNIPFINDELGDKTVLVAGPVRMFDLATFEQEINYDLDDALFADWAGRPAIMAQAIRVAE